MSQKPLYSADSLLLTLVDFLPDLQNIINSLKLSGIRFFH